MLSACLHHSHSHDNGQALAVFVFTVLLLVVVLIALLLANYEGIVYTRPDICQTRSKNHIYQEVVKQPERDS